jgi:hypothetical protein
MIAPLLAVLLNLTTFALAVGAVLLILILVTAMHRPPTRRCHECGRRVKLTSRTCMYCGYDFEPVRFHR